MKRAGQAAGFAGGVMIFGPSILVPLNVSAAPDGQSAKIPFKDVSSTAFPMLTPDILGSTTPTFSFAGEEVERRIYVTPDAPVTPDQINGESVYGPVIRGTRIQERPWSIITATMYMYGETAGIIYGGPESPDQTISMIEARKNSLVAMVRSGNDFTKPPVAETTIEELPEGPKVINLAMMFGNDGKTFGVFGTDGRLRKQVELPKPTADVGQDSFVLVYKYRNTPEAVITECAVIAPRAI
jgi:hypothetical protein